MSTLDRYLRVKAQTDLPSEMQMVYGLLEAAYTHMLMLQDAVDAETVRDVNMAVTDIWNALDLGGRLLRVQAQLEHTVVDRERALASCQKATQALNEALTRMAGLQTQYTSPAGIELYNQVNSKATSAYNRMNGIMNSLAAA